MLVKGGNLGQGPAENVGLARREDSIGAPHNAGKQCQPNAQVRRTRVAPILKLGEPNSKKSIDDSARASDGVLSGNLRAIITHSGHATNCASRLMT
jgi:hypothetical protein